MAVSKSIVRWNLLAAVALLAFWPGPAAFAQGTGEVFSSSGGGRSCGYPGYSYDMSKVEDAAKGYPNSRILILTPQEKRNLEDNLAAQDPRSGAPIVQMAPCFNCSQDYEACIFFSRDGLIPGGDEFGSNTPPSPGGDTSGKLNCTATVTLTASATTTTLTDARIGPESVILLMPTTAHAAAATTKVYVSARSTGLATLTHDSTADADRIFGYIVIG